MPIVTLGLSHDDVPYPPREHGRIRRPSPLSECGSAVTLTIYHSSDAAIRGHVFCSFLALILRKELDERCRKVGFRPEWGDVLRDLDRLQEVTITQDGREMTLRTPATGVIGPLFKAARIALPPNVRDASAP